MGLQISRVNAMPYRTDNDISEIGGYISTWYSVCTKAIFTSKGGYGNVEPKNAILVSVQKAYFPLRACKLL